MNLKKIISNTSWLIGEKVIIMIANLFVTVVLARVLGAEQYGMLNYLLAIIALVAPVTALGLNAIVTREIVNKPSDTNKIISTSLFLRFGCSLIVVSLFIGLILFSNVIQGKEQQVALVLLCLGNVFTCFYVMDFWFQAHVKAKVVTKMKFVIIVLFSIIKVLIALLSPKLIYVILAYSLEVALIGVGFLFIYNKTKEDNAFSFKDVDFNYARKLLSQSYWLILSGIASIIYLKIDQLMLRHMVDVEAVGTYAVASRLSEVWYFFANALVITLFPALLKIRGNPRNYLIKLQKICDILFIVALLLAILVSVFGPFFIVLLFGEEYKASGVILQWHIWAAVFVFMRALASKWLIAESLLKYSLITHGVGAIINVIANLYFIPRYAGEGAAIATIISYFAASFLAFWFSKSTRLIAVVMLKSILLPFTFGKRYWKIGNNS
ncbi:flippase [Pseudoalteromonas sp. SR41-4]|uniref:flippase n=1 Tax=Pseudoalteromonas sp. SR41-4 TaxID=2760950 RepID=UPI001601B216|nr:flippase [Pseudoalteromonas sp. SR41-4]MBB1295370.1 flippase [Pseudoalteromonas sp. SR41-4]